MLFKRRISKKVFRQLASKNVRKSAKDYFIYFFTLTFAVCLFYTFNSIGAQFAAFDIPDTLNYLSAAQGAMAGVSVLVCAIIGFLVVYANRFLMKRRKKEFGIYSILGMERRDISRILMKETVLIGGFSLIAGLVLGVLASQGLTMITSKIAGVGLASYSFIFSPGAMAASVIFFGLIFLFVHIFNVREMKKMKLIDLLYADRKNEEIPEEKKSALLKGILSIMFIIGGYLLIHFLSDRDLFKILGAGSTMIGIGTILLFFSIAGVLIKFLKNRKKFYYKGLNLFVVNQLGSRMKSTGFSVAVVCILMYLSVSIMGIGMGLGQSSMSLIGKTAPYDLSVEYYFDGKGGNDAAVEQSGIKNELEAKNAKLSSYIGESEEINFYVSENLNMQELFGKSAQGNQKMQKLYKTGNVWYVGLDEYNKLRTFQGKDAISLGDDEYAITYNEPEAKAVLVKFEEQGDTTLSIGNSNLNMKEGGIYSATLYNMNVLSDIATIVVPQKVTEGQKPYMRIMDANYEGNASDAYHALLDDMLKVKGFDYSSQKDIQIQIMSDKLMATYIGGYLGITFLVTAGAVLALQQLTQSADNKKRYNLLYKMGAGEKAMKKSLMTQMLFYFGLPFLVAVIHSGFIMAGVYRTIPYLTGADIARNILLASGLAVVLYGIYFITTYSGSKRILKL